METKLYDNVSSCSTIFVELEEHLDRNPQTSFELDEQFSRKQADLIDNADWLAELSFFLNKWCRNSNIGNMKKESIVISYLIHNQVRVSVSPKIYSQWQS